MSFGDVISASTAVGSTPLGVCVDDTYIYVCNYGSNSISVLNKTTLASVTTITTGANPFSAVVAGGYVWVAVYTAKQVAVINPTTLTVVKTINLTDAPIYIAANSTTVVTANYNAGTTTIIDIATQTVSLTFTSSPSCRGITIDDTYIYVTSSTGNYVRVYTLSNHTLVSTITTGTTPVGVVVDSAHIFVVNSASTSLTVINIGSWTVSGTYSLTSLGWNCALRDNVLVVTSGQRLPNTVQLYLTDNLSAGSIEAIPTGSQPYSAAIDESRLYITNSAGASLTVADVGLPSNKSVMAVSKVLASADDGYSQTSTQGESQSAFSTAAGMKIGNEQSSTFWQQGVSWARFKLDIPVSRVDSAKLRISPWSDASMGPYCALYAAAVDNAVNPTTHAGAIALARTTNNVSWQDVSNVVTTPLKSPDITNVVNEVLARPGWAQGNYLMILAVFNPYSYGSNANRLAAELSEQLIVSYTTGPTVTFWNGTAELSGTLSYWDGTTETPIVSAELAP